MFENSNFYADPDERSIDHELLLNGKKVVMSYTADNGIFDGAMGALEASRNDELKGSCPLIDVELHDAHKLKPRAVRKVSSRLILFQLQNKLVSSNIK